MKTDPSSAGRRPPMQLEHPNPVESFVFIVVNQQRIRVTAVWRVCMLALVTASISQFVWLQRSTQSLELALYGRSRTRGVAVTATVLASTAAALTVVAAAPFGTAASLAIAIAATIPGGLAILYVGSLVTCLTGELEAPRSRSVHPVVLFGAWAASLAIAMVGVAPSSGSTSTRILNVVLGGLLLPLWTACLQHAVNDACLEGRAPLRTDDGESFGSAMMNADPAHARAAVLMRSRLAATQLARPRLERLDVIPWCTIALATLCTAWYGVEVARFGLDPGEHQLLASGAATGRLILHGQWWRFFSENFVHMSLAHWAGNMFVLAFTGPVLERTIGRRGMLLLMGVGLLCASLLSLAVIPKWVVAGGESGIGAAVIGGCIGADPHRTEEIGQLGMWSGLMLLMSSLTPGVDFAAHGGGAAAGFLIAALLVRRVPAARPLLEPIVPVALVGSVAMPSAVNQLAAPPVVAPPTIAAAPPLIPPELLPPSG